MLILRKQKTVKSKSLWSAEQGVKQVIVDTLKHHFSFYCTQVTIRKENLVINWIMGLEVNKKIKEERGGIGISKKARVSECKRTRLCVGFWLGAVLLCVQNTTKGHIWGTASIKAHSPTHTYKTAQPRITKIIGSCDGAHGGHWEVLVGICCYLLCGVQLSSLWYQNQYN